MLSGLYVRYRGGLSGGDTITSQCWAMVSLARKQKKVIGGITKEYSRMYLSSAFIQVIASLPDLHFRLLMNDWRLFFCFFTSRWDVRWFSCGEQQQCVLQSASDLQPHAWSLQGNSSDFPNEPTVMPPLHNARPRKMRIWIQAIILLILLIATCNFSHIPPLQFTHKSIEIHHAIPE